MSKKLPTDHSVWVKDVSKIDEEFIKNYDNGDHIGCILKYPKELHENKNLKQALEHDLRLKKVHKVIAFHQEAWLKPYIDMNTELRKKAKNYFEKTLTN